MKKASRILYLILLATIIIVLADSAIRNRRSSKLKMEVLELEKEAFELEIEAFKKLEDEVSGIKDRD